jgi:crossover junction endodeoxyribonuclease RusA
VHWAAKSRAAKRYRWECRCEALRQRVRSYRPSDKVRVQLTFAPPDARRRDDDNMLASFKSGRDGLADAMGIDDQTMQIAGIEVAPPVSGGRVTVELLP